MRASLHCYLQLFCDAVFNIIILLQLLDGVDPMQILKSHIGLLILSWPGSKDHDKKGDNTIF